MDGERADRVAIGEFDRFLESDRGPVARGVGAPGNRLSAAVSPIGRPFVAIRSRFGERFHGRKQVENAGRAFAFARPHVFGNRAPLA